MLNQDVSIYCLKYAESVLSESMIFDDGNEQNYLPISFAVYLIVTEDKKIMVDAGCNTMPGFDMKRFYAPTFVLRQIGFLASDITDVIITHAHHDHIEAVHCFKNAVVHISKAEYESGKHYISDAIQVNVFEKEYDIHSQIKVIECGGHSKGSCIVEITTEDLTHILPGDECYTNANIEQKRCTGANYNKEKSIGFIEKYSDKKYRVHTCHDISLKTERII